MQAFSETLEQKWESEWGLSNPEFRFMNSPSSLPGQLLAQKVTEKKGIAFFLNHILYVDDGTFVFESQNELNQGAVRLFDHFAIFGLKMHIGRDGKKSKTEAIFFPRSNIQEHEYDLTTPIPVKDGYISFVREAKYLGAIVTDDLKDEREISKRIEKGWQLVGMLRRFFNDPDVCIQSKARIYDAFIINTVLWGCESWAMTDKVKRLLSTFQHSSIRSILQVSMNQVKERHITNYATRKRFDNIPHILDIITKRQVQWLGVIAQKDNSSVQWRMIASWTSHKRKRGKPQTNLRHSYVEALQQVLGEDKVDKTGKLENWMYTASVKGHWKMAIKHWWKRKRAIYCIMDWWKKSLRQRKEAKRREHAAICIRDWWKEKIQTRNSPGTRNSMDVTRKNIIQAH
jgi:hypothetical protein